MSLVIKKCLNCGAQVEVIKDCTCKDCGIKCCGQKMVEIKTNTTECAIEKHLPQVEKVGDYILVSVNHVMEEEHYIEWIGLKSDKISAKKHFNSKDTAKAVFPYIKGAIVYAYCNKHGLWSVIID